MNDQWFYGENGQQRGPVSIAALRDRLSAGLMRGDDLVWREGMGAWTAAASVPELADLASAPATAPPAYATPTGYPTGPMGYYNGAGALANYEFVGFWWRVLSYIIDYVITYAVGLPIGFVIGFSLAMVNGNNESTVIAAQLIAGGFGLLLTWLYFALMESSSKQATVGKMAIGVRVVDAQGARLSFGRASGRFFAKMLSAIILGVGFFMVGFTQFKQGLHDMIASTFVVRPRPTGFPIQQPYQQ